MIDIKSYVEGLEIINTGQAHVILGNTLTIKFPIEDPMHIEVKFINDSLSERRINWIVEQEILKITFQNFASSSGSGILHPWKIGGYLGRELFMTFYSKSIQDGSDTFLICDYIFYLGKEVKID